VNPQLGPTYRLEDVSMPGRKRIVFAAGPPYQEIAFYIVDKEWDMSHTKDFINNFQDGILQLWFKITK
jgi:hypothetical protein